jgi:hypothetical protein
MRGYLCCVLLRCDVCCVTKPEVLEWGAYDKTLRATSARQTSPAFNTLRVYLVRCSEGQVGDSEWLVETRKEVR